MANESSYTMDIGGFMKSFVDFEEKFMTFDSFGGKKSFSMLLIMITATKILKQENSQRMP